MQGAPEQTGEDLLCYIRWSGKQKPEGKEGGKEPWQEDNSRHRDRKCKGLGAGLSSGLIQEYPGAQRI